MSGSRPADTDGRTYAEPSAAAVAAHPDPKYRVTMRSVALGADGETRTRERLDYVPKSALDRYVDLVRPTWQSVVVSEEPDFGPGGIDGDTHIAHLTGEQA